MKRTVKKISCILLCFLIVFSGLFIGCNQTNQDGKNVVAGKYIVSNGSTEYKLLIPETPLDMESYAAGEFQTFFYEATGLGIDIVKENESLNTNGKYISLGNTNLADESKVTLKADANSQAFKIQTVNDSIIILGKTSFGTLWGAYELLTQLFNYEYFATETYVIDRNVTEVPLYKFNFFDQPDIEQRIGTNGQTYSNVTVGRRLRYIQMSNVFVMGKWAHCSFDYLGGSADKIDERYLGNTKKQLCFTTHGDPKAYEDMLNDVYEAMIQNIINDGNDEKMNIMFGVQDHPNTVCTCSSCEDAKNYYGTDSASVIIFCNKLHRKLKAYLAENNIDRELNLIFFAYCDYEPAPVKKNSKGEWEPIRPEVKCDPGVYVQIASINANWQVPLTHEKNNSTSEIFKQWSALSDRVLVWGYHANYSDFLSPFDHFNAMQANYEMFKEYNVQNLFDQGKHKSIGSGFIILREYLAAKLGWNVNANVKELTKNFFEAYFGAASDIMLKYYDEFRTIMAYNDLTAYAGVYNANLASKNFWPQPTVFKFLDYFDEAYAALEELKEISYEEYARCYMHVLRESISIRYVYLQTYADKLSADYQTQVQQFIADCEATGVTYATESVLVKDMFV